MGKRLGRPPKRVETVLAQLKEDWVKGQRPGLRLPSENALAKQYNVSRPTIRNVLEQLQRMKLVVRKPSAGCFVGRFPRVNSFVFLQKEIGVSFARPYGALSDSFQVSILDGLLREISMVEMNLSVCGVEWRWLGSQTPSAFFSPPHILGLFLIGRHDPHILDPLISMNKPLVGLDFDGTQEGIDSFVLDNAGAGEALAKRLHRLGHRRVVYLVESPEKEFHKRDEAWSERADGFFRAWAKFQAPAPTCFNIEMRGVYTGLLPQLEAALAAPPKQRPTAVVMPGYDGLRPIKEVLHRLRLEVGKDVTLVSYGHSSQYTEMTSVRFNGAELGRQACEHMLNLVCNQRPFSSKRKLVKVKGYYEAGNTHGRAGS